MYGFMGRILRVNLTDGKSSTEAVSEGDAKMFLGGRGPNRAQNVGRCYRNSPDALI